MNLPNKLTVLRMFLVPIFIIFYYLGFNLYSTLIFIFASITDFLDGYIARKNNLVTNFGKFMDPLADKILVISALILLLEKNIFPGWILIIVISREFIVSGLRLIAASNNVTIAAGNLGKLKTVSQMISIILLLLNNFPFGTNGLRIDLYLLYFSTFLTIISGIEYVYKNRNILDLSNK